MSNIYTGIMNAVDKFIASSLAYTNAVVYFMEVEAVSTKEGNEEFRKIHLAFEERAKALGLNVRSYLRCNIFAASIASIELFFQEALKCVIAEHPKKIGSMQFKLSEILEFSSKDELLSRAIDDYLNKLAYKRPFEYLEELASILSIEKQPIEELWPVFVEAKARRDLGVHNGWICNDTYLRKVKEAGIDTDKKVGDKLMPDDKDYFFSVVDNLIGLARIIALQIHDKYCE